MGSPRPNHRPAWPWQRARDAQEALDRAHEAARKAKDARTEQERKLASEQELHRKIDRLSQENHLAGLVWEIIGGDK